MKETWVPIKGYEGLYMVSNLGHVKSLPRKGTKERTMSLFFKRGYLCVGLSKNDIQKGFFLHRLLAEAFLSNLNNYPYVCHKDGNKLNNDLGNLYWGTAKMNNEDKIKHGTILKGEQNPRAKLTEKDIYRIRLLRNNGLTISVLAKQFNVANNTIHQVIIGGTWKHI
jgi:hypothetical protein